MSWWLSAVVAPIHPFISSPGKTELGTPGAMSQVLLREGHPQHLILVYTAQYTIGLCCKAAQ